MAEALPQTTVLQGYLERMRAGDVTARDELFRQICGRLERLTRKMLKSFPGVHRWALTDDVLQSALVRLLRALREVQPASMREFFALSAQQIRRELLDLARHFYGPQGPGTKHASQPGNNGAYDRADDSAELGLLAAWTEFHQQVSQLPSGEREVVDLLFYQELTQAEAAELLDVTVRTVQRRWHAALLKLHQTLQGQWPGS
jgi:RNA polymerase sigma-70 factor (ECF subfamily)